MGYSCGFPRWSEWDMFMTCDHHQVNCIYPSLDNQYGCQSAILKMCNHCCHLKFSFSMKNFFIQYNCFNFYLYVVSGLAHLEALEILSNQSEKRVQSLLGAMPLEALDSIKQELITIKQVFELDEEDEGTLYYSTSAAL